MLKLYYAENKYLEIGHLKIDGKYVDSSLVAIAANDNRKESYNPGETPVALSMPSEVQSIGEFRSTVRNNTLYVLYLDSSLTKSTKFGVIYSSFSNEIRFYNTDLYVPGSEWDGCFETFEFPDLWGGLFEPQLVSIYASKESLDNNEQEYLYFIRKMAKYENQILNNKFPVGVNNLSSSILTVPFVLIANKLGPLGFSFKPGYNWQYIRLNSFINTANIYYMFTKKLLIPVDKMYINGTFERPAVSYDPRKLDIATLHYNFDGQGLIGLNSKSVNYSLDYDNISIRKYSTADMLFVQMPEKFYGYSELYNTLSYKKLYNTGMNNPSWLVATADNPKLLNTFVATNGNALYYYCQTVDISNLSKQCKEVYPDSTFLSEIDGDDINIPAVVIAYNFNVNSRYSEFDGYNRSYCTFRYGYGDDVGKITGLEYSTLLYNGQVQKFEDTVPNYEFPENEGGGGSTPTPSSGGNGTWSDTDDKTSIDPSADPSSDPTAPMPSSIGISGNCTIVKLNNVAVSSLASQSWTESGWLDYIKKFQGTSRIGEGITDIKTCFVDIAEGAQVTVSKIAGFTIATPINANSVYQYSQYSFGSISIPRYFDSYLDFAPFTEFTLELPFAQPVPIPPEQVVGDTLSIILRVDVMSATALYYISNSKHLICQVPADIFVDIPFTSSEYTLSRKQMLANSLISVGKMGYSAASQNYLGMSVAGVEGAMEPIMQSINQEANRNITQISAGGGPGATGAMGIKKAILKISRPYVEIPSDYYRFVGAPSGFIRQLSSCSGYFSVSDLYGNISCTDDEYNEIVDLLRAGVFP